MGKNTTELMKDLKKAKSYSEFAEKNKELLFDGNLANWLSGLIEQRGIDKREAIRLSEINEIYAYQILAGTRRPSRDKLICFCIGLRLPLADIQQTLKYGGYAELYARSARDSIILYGIKNKQNLIQINENLFDNGEKTL